MTAPLPKRIPAGYVRFVALVRPPPIWELPPFDAKPASHKLYTRKVRPSGIDPHVFNGWQPVGVALAMCRRLRTAGSIMAREDLREAVEFEHRRRFGSRKNWMQVYRRALSGARKHGWLQTFDVPEGIPVGRVPGAPCLQCGAWLTPKRRQAIAEQEQTPYSAIDVDVWVGD